MTGTRACRRIHYMAIIYRPISWHAGHTLFTNVAESVRNKKHYEKNKVCRKDDGHRYNLNFADEILHVLALAQKDDFVRDMYWPNVCPRPVGCRDVSVISLLYTRTIIVGVLTVGACCRLRPVQPVCRCVVRTLAGAADVAGAAGAWFIHTPHSWLTGVVSNISQCQIAFICGIW